MIGMFSVITKAFNRSILLPLLLLLSFQSYAADKPVLRLVHTHFPPWFIVEGDHYSGIDVLVVQELARRLDLVVEVNDCPIMRCFMQMRKGQADLMSSLFKRPEREEFMLFIEPYYFSAHDTVFYVKSGRMNILKNYQDLYKLSVGTTKKIAYSTRFDADKRIDKQVVVNQAQLPKMLMSGRIDTFLGDETVLDYLVITAGMESAFEKTDFRFKHPGLGGHMALSKMSPLAPRVNEFNIVLESMVNDGTIQSIIDRFYDQLREDYALLQHDQ